MKMTADEELVPKKKCTSEIWQYFGFEREDVSQMQVRITHKSCRKLWLRREEIQLISAVIWNTTTGSYLKTFESVRQYPPKLLTKSQVTIREPYRKPSIKVLQMQRLTEKRGNATRN